MAYEATEWVCGETITADGLNNLEEGVQDALECCEGGGSSLEINLSRVANYGDDDYATIPFICDTELSVITEAVKSGQTVIAHAIEYRNTETPPLLANAWTSDVSYVLGNLTIPLAIQSWMGRMATLAPDPTKTNEWKIYITPNA